jgi:hypothetical protein
VLTAARALDLRAPLQPGPATAAVRDLVRTAVDGPGPDRHLSPDMEAVTALVASGAVRDAALGSAAPGANAPGSAGPGSAVPFTNGFDRHGAGAADENRSQTD